MSGEKGDSSGKQDSEAILAQARTILEDLSKVRTETDGHLKAVQNSRAQADTILASANGLSDVRKKAEENVNVSSSLLDEIKRFRIQSEEVLKATEAARKKADDEASY